MFADKFLASRFGVSRKPRFDFSQQLNNCNKERFNRIHSNTTVFALSYDNGVILAGDRRTSGGYYEIVSDNTVKVQQVTSHSGLAAAGFCNVIEDLKEGLIGVSSKFEMLYGKELSVDGQANFMKLLLEPWWFSSVYSWYWMVGIPIIAGYDTLRRKPRIFVFDESGFYYEPEFFGGTGCGFDVIKGLVRDQWRPKMGLENAILIAMRAMLQSGDDSSGVSNVRLSLPTIAMIDKDGFKILPEEFLGETRKLLLKNKDGLK